MPSVTVMCQSALRVRAVARKSHAPSLGRRIEKFRAALWAAGIRTHMLVCVGACLFMIVSAYGFAPVLGPNVVLDPSRVAAQVVSGIGGSMIPTAVIIQASDHTMKLLGINSSCIEQQCTGAHRRVAYFEREPIFLSPERSTA